MLDKETGHLDAVIEASTVNAYRTAAADAVAVSVLARKNARCLTVLGTGHQAFYECIAVCRVRDIESVFIVGRTQKKAQNMVNKLVRLGIHAQVKEVEIACHAADIIIIATTARGPLFEHADLYCDFCSQLVQIGEFQHADKNTVINKLTMIGKVLSGRSQGRKNNTDITIFDSSGIAVQDLFIGQYLLDAAIDAGHCIECQ